MDVGLVPLAEKAREIAADHAATGEAQQRLAPDVVEAVRGAGFARHQVPAQWGGSAATFAELAQAVIAVGEGCAAAAWCASLYAYASRLAAHLPIEGQRELWSTGPDTLLAAGIVPSGTAEPVDAGGTRGWRISGRWHGVTAAETAEWLLVCGPPPAGSRFEPRFFAVPRADVEIERTWDSLGMRATGSHTVVLRDVVAPAHRSFPRSDAMAGRGTLSAATCHTAPLGAVGGLAAVAPAVGGALGAVRAYCAGLATSDRTARAELAVTRASGEIDAARLLVERAADVLDTGVLTRAAAARNARDAALAAELLVNAVTSLVRVGGTASYSAAHPLQRFWRDTMSAASHMTLRLDESAPAFVRSFLGAT